MPSKPGEAERSAIVFGGLISTLTDEAYERRNRNNTSLPNVLLVLDEAGNTAASWLPSLSTTCASVGITLMTFWQSLAQITHRYGDQTNTLVTNHTTKIFFGGISDAMTGDAAAKLSGNQEVLTRSATTDRTMTGRHSTTENTTATPLVSADLVRQIKPFHALCIHGTLHRSTYAPASGGATVRFEHEPKPSSCRSEHSPIGSGPTCPTPPIPVVTEHRDQGLPRRPPARDSTPPKRRNGNAIAERTRRDAARVFDIIQLPSKSATVIEL